MKIHHKNLSSHHNDIDYWHQWQHINENMPNNLPLCHWGKKIKFILILPLWWCFSPLKFLSPFDINGKGLLPLWSTYVFLHVVDQNMNFGNSPMESCFSFHNCMTPPINMLSLPLTTLPLCFWKGSSSWQNLFPCQFTNCLSQSIGIFVFK